MTDRTDGFYVGAPWGGIIFIPETELDITSTQILQKPVNVVLAEEATRGGLKGKPGEAGAMTKETLRRIFKE